MTDAPAHWPSLTAPGMRPVWEPARARLERSGLDNRGRITLPELDADARRTLTALIGRRPGRTLDLAMLETGLRRLGVGADLPSALATLGHPASPDPARRRAERAEAAAARQAARAEAASWPEPWSKGWIDAVVRAGALRGLDRSTAVNVVVAARAVLDAIDARAVDGAAPLSRVELAAQVLGHAHALNTGSRVEAAVTRALGFRAGTAGERDLWEQAGVHLDLTSGPALTWNLPLVPGSGLATITAPATALGVPIHLTRLALTDHPVQVAAGADVLIVENPRVAEAAAQGRVPRSVVSAGGSPSGAVQLLVRQLVAAGAVVGYHGDFDVAGLVLCARMAAIGTTPWRMTSDDYLSALAAADAAGVELPVDEADPPPTPWDPTLAEVFAAERRIVHEERLLPGLLTP